MILTRKRLLGDTVFFSLAGYQSRLHFVSLRALILTSTMLMLIFINY